MDILDLQRNDTANAVIVYRDLAMKAATLSQYEDGVSMLLQLQDDPTELEEAMDKVDKERLVAGALARLRR